MAGGDQTFSSCLRAGAYLGDISALSFIHLPLHLSPLPLLVAGTGSQLLVYDVKSGSLLNSFEVFQGIRVHGMALSSADPPAVSDFSIAVFGERRVKLFQLSVGAGLLVRLELVRQLPRFDHWVLDVCFLKEDCVIAIGLSDNSVAIWDPTQSDVALRVRASDRCLLYSMRMLGDRVEDLHVASGTIYNDIIIWRLRPEKVLSCSLESASRCASGCGEIQFPNKQYVAANLSRLTGHEGSIFRMAWSSDGTKLMSCSDDRSARIWMIKAQAHDFDEKTCGDGILTNLTLFGHNARIWDCYISDSVVITAGEDCTCRVWGVEGNLLLMIKEHIGRGIWRCLYDPSSSLLITAGFDSAIKVHLLYSSTLSKAGVQQEVLNDLEDRKEIFTISAPMIPQRLGLIDSKSEYIRCLRFKRENILYVATNNGYLHQLEFSNPEDVTWIELAQVSKGTPIVCMDLLNSSEFPLDAIDMVAMGDGKGIVTVVGIVEEDGIPRLASSVAWSAEKERQLLEIFWCKSLGCGCLFTADPGGALKLWKIRGTALSDSGCIDMDPHVSLLAVFQTCFGSRIMCLAACIRVEILVCGDKSGNHTVFPLSDSLLTSDSRHPVGKIPLLTRFKGAHGISSVTSILITASNIEYAEIRTTGGDGCICYFKYETNLRTLEFVGMKQVKELSTIQSVIGNSSAMEGLTKGNYAIGFTSADFIVWDILSETKMLQIPCGGWRRSYSYLLGDVPEYQNCFAYLKDHNIHIYRLWGKDHDRKLLPQVLHMQYHGREIHSLCLMTSGLQFISDNSYYLWTATGCEDGTVRLTRYTSANVGSWCESKLLGEHVGGSAVRSLCFVSKIYTTEAGQNCNADGTYIPSALSDVKDDLFLLISVGAKQVLTSWILQSGVAQVQNHHSGNLSGSDYMSHPQINDFSSISFKWLSTHMPPKFSSSHQKVEYLLDSDETTNTPSEKHASESCLYECKKPKPKSSLFDQNENDWRYLAVTAFLVRPSCSRITVCFIVVACSDATLTLRALLLPYRLWFDVALLVPQTSPVLALQHIVVPVFASSADKGQTGNTYIIVSGSTNGSITFWDLTEEVEYFMQLVLKLQPHRLIDCQKRPKTGRGSQGGRWWRSLTDQPSGANVEGALEKVEAGHNVNGHSSIIASGASSVGESDSVNIERKSPQTIPFTNAHLLEKHSDTLPSDKHELKPLYVLNSVHQSGVNCLHVSKMRIGLHSESETGYCVVSGGDDQAVHCLVLNLTVQLKNPDSRNKQSTDNINNQQDVMLGQQSGSSFSWKSSCISFNNKLKVLHQNKISSAHGSAVKGIWTDGTWAFSTGLDQRVRCWKVEHDGKLGEHSHLVICVPEPETLDAILCSSENSSKNRYQIAVAGRGMQMVDFCP